MRDLVRTYGTKTQYRAPVSGNDAQVGRRHNWNMAKKDGRHRRSDARPGWYVAEWLDYLGLKQTVLIEGMGRSKGRISELVSGKQRWNEDDLYQISQILRVTRGFLLEVNPLTPEGRTIAQRGRLPTPPMPVHTQKKTGTQGR